MSTLFIPKRNMFGMPSKTAGIYLDDETVRFEKSALYRYIDFQITIPEYTSVTVKLTDIRHIVYYGRYDAELAGLGGTTAASSILFLDQHKRLLATMALLHNEFSQGDTVRLLTALQQQNTGYALDETLRQVMVERSFAPIRKKDLQIRLKSLKKVLLLLALCIGLLVLLPILFPVPFPISSQQLFHEIFVPFGDVKVLPKL